MVRLADDLMYRGKRDGRGRIVHAAWESMAKGLRSTGGRSTSIITADEWDEAAGADRAVRPRIAAVEPVTDAADDALSGMAV